MKLNHFFLFCFIFLFLVVTPMVTAQPPFVTNINTAEGLQIFHPEFLAVEQNREFNLHIHVSNISNGYPLNNTQCDCFLHLYDKSGSHTMDRETPLDKNGNKFDHEVEILAGNFSQLGIHGFYMWCNSTDGLLGGEAKGIFFVTADGFEQETFPKEFYFILLALLLIFSSFFFERLRMFKYMGSMMLMVLGVLTLYPGYSFINWTTLFGKALGFILLAFGFYFLIEDSFSRGKQEGYYEQEDDDD